MLEVFCGRKLFDYTQPEEDVHLLYLLKRKASEDKLHEMLDNRCEEMLQWEEAIENDKDCWVVLGK